MDLIERLIGLSFPVAVVSVYFFVMFAIGDWLWERLGLKRLRWMDYFVILTLGMVVLSFYYFGIGMLGIYNSITVLLIPLSIGLVLVILNLKKYISKFMQLFIKAQAKFKSLQFWGNTIILVVVGIAFFLFSALPDWGFDSNWYHLSQPFLYLQKGYMFHLGGFVFNSGFPQFWEMLYLPLLIFANDLILPVFAVFTTALLFLIVYVFGGQLRMSDILKIVTVLSVALIPTVLRHAGLAYIDTPLAIFTTLGLFYAIRVVKESNRQNIIALSIVLIPIASMKYSALFYLMAILVFTIVNMVKNKLNFVDVLKIVLMIGAPASLGLGLWLLRNQIQIGWFLDPVGTVPLTNYTAGIYSTWPEFIVSRIINSKQIFAEYLREYTYLMFVVLGLVILLIRNKSWNYLLLGFVCLCAWYFLMPPGNEIRYLLPVIPFGLLIFYQISPKWLSICACVLFLGTLPKQIVNANLVYQTYFDYAIGNKSINEYKNEVFVKEPLMFYDYTRNLKKIIGEDEVLSIDNHLIFPTIKDFNCDEITVSPIKTEQLTSFSDLADQMKNNSYQYLMVNQRTLQTRFSDFRDQVEDNFKLVYLDDSYGNIRTAYRLIQ